MKNISAPRFALVVLLGAGLLAAPQAASASSSNHKHNDKLTVTVSGPPDDQSFDLEAGLACPGFALHIDLKDSRTRTKTFTTKAGKVVRTIESGNGWEKTYTNMTTGKKVVFPSKHFSADTTFDKKGVATVTTTGRFGLILFPTDVPAGPSTTEYKGRVVYTIDPEPPNVFTIKKVKAKTTDVCAMLARKK